MNDSRLTVEDFSRVPWGGMATHDDGRRAIRIPRVLGDGLPWFVKGHERYLWRSDAEMVKGGWRVVEMVTYATLLHHQEHAEAKRERLISHIEELQKVIADRNTEIDELKAKLESVKVDGFTVKTPREALDAAWELSYVPEDGVIPAGAAYIWHGCEQPDEITVDIMNSEIEAVNGCGERRLLDPPEPEPWEVSPFVICTNADGEPFFLKRIGSAGWFSWLNMNSGFYLSSDEVKTLDPIPFDPDKVEQ